jgi:hypothetical protein
LAVLGQQVGDPLGVQRCGTARPAGE